MKCAISGKTITENDAYSTFGKHYVLESEVERLGLNTPEKIKAKFPDYDELSLK